MFNSTKNRDILGLTPLTLAFSIICFVAFAGSDGMAQSQRFGTSYSISTDKGRKIFVMISPNANEDERIQDVKIREHARSLRNKYPKSGLYLVGKSEKSLWSIDWYSGKVWLSNDGSYLISSNGISNLNDKNEIRLDSQVLSFYFEGKESRIYRLSDLVKNSSKLPGAPRFVFWACRGTFDEINDRFTVVTFDFQEHVFESDGQLVSTTGLSKIPCNSPFDIQFE